MKRSHIFHLIRIVIGSIFVFSALAKLYTIDNFEIYLYSQQLFSFDMSSVVARIIIAAELAVGMLLITNLFFKVVYKISLYLLLFLSLFLVFKIFVSNHESCNCFGELVVLNPAESLLKNSVLIVLLLIIKKNNNSCQVRFKKIYLAFILLFTLIFPSIFSPPDFIYRKFHTTKQNIATEEQIHLSDTTLNISEGKKVLAFLSMGCKYCILAAHKISIIADRTNTHENINYIFFGDERDLEGFWDKSQSKHFRHTIIPFAELVGITDGRLPAVFFVENGLVKQKTTYRDLTEAQFLEFFSK